MAGTVHQAGATKIYTKQQLTDTWAENTLLFPASVVRRSAGQIESLMVSESYAGGSPKGRREYLHKHWIKLTYTPDGGAETAFWVGNIEDARDMEDAEAVVWIAVSLEAQLQRIDLIRTYAEAAQGDCVSVHNLRFNEYMDRGAPPGWGQKSATPYHFSKNPSGSPSHTWHSPHAEDDDTDDEAYVFGTDSDWTMQEILEALLAWHASTGYGIYSETPPSDSYTASPVGFKLSASTAAAAYLAAMTESIDLTGKNLFQAIDYLVRRSGPLYWWLDWSAWEQGSQNYIDLKVQSRLYSDESGAATLREVAKADTLPSVVRARVKDRATKVIARGAPIKAMFTVRGPDDMGDGPHSAAGWTSGQQTEWLAVQDSIAEELKGIYDDVFLRILFGDTDTNGAGDYRWTEVLRRPDITLDDGTKYGLGTGPYYARPRPILPFNLTYRGWTNPTFNGDSLPSAPAGETWEPEHDPILCWYVPGTIDAQNRALRIDRIRRLGNQAGVRIVDKGLRADNYPYLGAEDPTLRDRWKDLVFTVSVACDYNLQYIAGSATDVDDDQRRTVLVEVPDAEWWYAPVGTVISIAEDGTETTIGGVLRNDYARLKEIATDRLKMLDRSTPDYQGDIRLRFVNTDYDLGDFVKSYGGYSIKAPIMSVTHELMNEGAWGTVVTTFKPVNAWDTA